MKLHPSFTPHGPQRGVERAQRAAGWDGDAHGSLQPGPRAEPELFKSQFTANHICPHRVFVPLTKRGQAGSQQEHFPVRAEVFLPSTRECRSVREAWKTQDVLLQ